MQKITASPHHPQNKTKHRSFLECTDRLSETFLIATLDDYSFNTFFYKQLHIYLCNIIVMYSIFNQKTVHHDILYKRATHRLTFLEE